MRVFDATLREDGKKPRNVWARPASGKRETYHAVLDVQLGTEQAALCGSEPPSDDAWIADYEGRSPPEDEKCERCLALRRAAKR